MTTAPTDPGMYAAVTKDGEFCIYTPDATGNADFRGDAFIQSGDSKLEPELAKALGIRPFVIKAGKYLITHEGKVAYINFSQPLR